jgi:hypothetical protein
MSKNLAQWSSAEQVQRFLDEHVDPDAITNEFRARAVRRPSTDEEIQGFVRSRLDVSADSATKLLKVWREEEERRCEEGRFKRIYSAVVAERNSIV